MKQKKQKEEPKHKEIVKQLIDYDTGEMIEIYEGDRLKIIRESQNEAVQQSKKHIQLNKDMELINNELGGFVFALFKYSDELLKEYPEITPEDISKLFYLSTYVDYDGYLIYEDSYMTREDMQRLVQLNKANFIIFLNKMKKCNIIVQDDNKNLKINKEHFTKGEIDLEIKKYYDYTRVYVDTIRFLFENVPKRKHKQLGNYFKMIPYMHRQKNILCWNPNDNVGCVKPLTVRDLQSILHIHRNTSRSFINELLSTRLNNGEAIVVFIKNDKDDGNLPILVNPNVFYGGNYDLKDGRNGLIRWFYNN